MNPKFIDAKMFDQARRSNWSKYGTLKEKLTGA